MELRPPNPPDENFAPKPPPVFNRAWCFAKSGAPRTRAHTALANPMLVGPGPHPTDYLFDLTTDALGAFAALALLLAQAHDRFDGALAVFRRMNPHLDLAEVRSKIDAVLRKGETRLKASRGRRVGAASRAATYQKTEERPPLDLSAYAPQGLSQRTWLMLGAALGGEALLTGVQIGPELGGGPVEGVVVAATVSLLIGLCAFFAGAVGLRLLRHRDGGQRLRGAGALAASVLGALFLIAAMARLRFANDTAALPGFSMFAALCLSLVQLFGFGFAVSKFAGGPGMPWSAYWGEADAHRDLHRLDLDAARIVEEMHDEIDAIVDGWMAAAKAHCLRQKQAEADLNRAARALQRAALHGRHEMQQVLVKALHHWHIFEAVWYAKRPHDRVVPLDLVAPQIAPVEPIVAPALAASAAAVGAAEHDLAERISSAEDLRADAHDRVDQLAAAMANSSQPSPVFENDEDDRLDTAPQPTEAQKRPSWWTRFLPRGRS